MLAIVREDRRPVSWRAGDTAAGAAGLSAQALGVARALDALPAGGWEEFADLVRYLAANWSDLEEVICVVVVA